jgi:hypothetical protein
MKSGPSHNTSTFVFYVVCYLQIMDFGLHFSQFEQHLVLIDLFFVQFLGHISFGGSADGQHKEGASEMGS